MTIGVALALASLAVLIFFIHHISQRIQAENLIADVGQDFQRALTVLFPEGIGARRERDKGEPGDESRSGKTRMSGFGQKRLLAARE